MYISSKTNLIRSTNAYLVFLAAPQKHSIYRETVSGSELAAVVAAVAAALVPENNFPCEMASQNAGTGFREAQPAQPLPMFKAFTKFK